MLLAYRLLSNLLGGASHARLFGVYGIALTPTRLPSRGAARRSVEGLFGVETITPYTCSGLMVREYYIRIWNTPDNKGGESTVVLWLLALVWEISVGDGKWGMRERRSRLCHLSCALESLELNEPIHYVVQYLIIEKMASRRVASRRVASTFSIYLVESCNSLQ